MTASKVLCSSKKSIKTLLHFVFNSHHASWPQSSLPIGLYCDPSSKSMREKPTLSLHLLAVHLPCKIARSTPCIHMHSASRTAGMLFSWINVFFWSEMKPKSPRASNLTTGSARFTTIRKAQKSISGWSESRTYSGCLKTFCRFANNLPTLLVVEDAFWWLRTGL